jgi:hypothetical protein
LEHSEVEHRQRNDSQGPLATRGQGVRQQDDHDRTDHPGQIPGAIATIGAPYDITLEELRLETFFPADEASAAALRTLSA